MPNSTCFTLVHPRHREMFVCLSFFLLVASQVACGGASWSFFPVFPAEIPLGKYHVEKRQGVEVFS